MTAFTCTKHNEYCPEGVCRWCEPAESVPDGGWGMEAPAAPESIWSAWGAGQVTQFSLCYEHLWSYPVGGVCSVCVEKRK